MAELKTLDAFGNHRGTVIEVQIFRDSEVGIYASGMHTIIIMHVRMQMLKHMYIVSHLIICLHATVLGL